MSTQLKDLRKHPIASREEANRIVQQYFPHVGYYAQRDIAAFLFPEQEAQGMRIARKAIKRGVLKPAGEFNPSTHRIIRLDRTTYSVPEAWFTIESPKETSRDNLTRTRKSKVESKFRSYFENPSRWIKECSINVTEKEPMFVPYSFASSRGWSLRASTKMIRWLHAWTDKFIIAEHTGLTEQVGDCQVTPILAWDRSEFREANSLRPKPMWHATDGNIHSITTTRELALSSIRTKSKNRVLKTLMAA